MNQKDLCEHTRIRLIAAAVGHQQCTKTESTLIPLPGTPKFIAIGTLPAIAKALMVEPPASTPPSTAPAPQQSEPKAKADATAGRAMEIAAVLPNGVAVTNVYEAYEAGLAKATQAAPSAKAEPIPGELTDAAIDEVWEAMPGGAEGWLKQFGYRQFARSIARHVLVRIAASMAGTIRPTDDELWEQTIGERDCYHEWADKLANAIAAYFGAEIGEHSNMNCPWAEALEVIEGAAPAPAVQAEDARNRVLEEAAVACDKRRYEAAAQVIRALRTPSTSQTSEGADRG